LILGQRFFANTMPINLSLLPVIAFLVAVPTVSPLVAKFGAHDLSRIAEVLICLLCALALLLPVSPKLSGRPLLSGRVVLATFGFLLMATISTALAAQPAAAARELALFMGLGSIVAVVARSTHRAHFDSLAASVVSAGLLHAGLVMVVILQVLAQSGRLDPYLVVPGYDNHRFFSHVQTAMLPLLVVATNRLIRGGAFARLAWAALVLHFALLYFLQGRATGLGLLCAGLICLVLFRRQALKFAVHLSLAALAGAILYLVIFVALPALVGTASEKARAVGDLSSFQERVSLWRLAWAYALQDPWFGQGPMHFAHRPNTIGAHPHNIYLQLAAELGLPFVLSLVAWSVWSLWRMASVVRACNDPEQATIGVALFATLVAAAVDGCFSGNFVMPVSQVWIAVALGWAIAWTRMNSPAAPSFDARRPLPWGVLTLSSVTLIAQLWLAWSIAPELVDLGRHMSVTTENASAPVTTAPRFWSNGWF
jgi:O-antigen ligase